MDFGFDMNTDDSIDDFDIVDLDNEGYFGKTHYLGIPVLICKKNNRKKGYKKGYVNAAKLCQYGGKKYIHWNQNATSKKTVLVTANLLGLNVDDMKFEVIHSTLECRGTYVHPKLVAYIASWCSIEFSAALSAFVDRYHHYRSRYHKTINNKIDESSSLKEKIQLTYEKKKDEFSKIRFLGEKNSIGCVYVFTDDIYYKIGFSTDVVKRKSTLQTGNPNELKTVLKVIVVDPAKVETILLERFSENMIRGEWFVLDEEDLRELEEILEENRN